MTRWISRTAAVALLVVTLPIMGHSQETVPASDLGARLRERYDVVALQQGVALVPREGGGGIRLIQIEGGVVSIDGQTLTGAQLRDRLGDDADLVLQASYLASQQQRDLAGATGAAGASQPPPVQRTEVTRGDRVRFGGDVAVGRNERLDGDVVAIGGSVDVQGEVTGDVVSIGGTLTLGPDAVVRGDAVSVGGSLDRSPGARVEGDLVEAGPGGRGFRSGAFFPTIFGSFWSRLGSLAATLIRLSLVLLVGLVVIAFGRGAIERVAARTAATPGRAGVVGLLAQILFVPVLVLTCVVLVVSIVGIPLLVLVPFAVLLLVLVMLVGFVGLAYHVGRLAAARVRGVEPGPYASFAIGVLAIGAVTLIAKLGALAGGFLLAPLTALGYVLEYIAWTVGFGAALLYWYETQTRFGRRPTSPAAPTPVPGEA
jgi:hypothetical protein